MIAKTEDMIHALAHALDIVKKFPNTLLDTDDQANETACILMRCMSVIAATSEIMGKAPDEPHQNHGEWNNIPHGNTMAGQEPMVPVSAVMPLIAAADNILIDKSAEPGGELSCWEHELCVCAEIAKQRCNKAKEAMK